MAHCKLKKTRTLAIILIGGGAIAGFVVALIWVGIPTVVQVVRTPQNLDYFGMFLSLAFIYGSLVGAASGLVAFSSAILVFMLFREDRVSPIVAALVSGSLSSALVYLGLWLLPNTWGIVGALPTGIAVALCVFFWNKCGSSQSRV